MAAPPDWHNCARQMEAMEATKLLTKFFFCKASVGPQLLGGKHEQPRQAWPQYIQGDHQLQQLLSNARYCQLRKQSYMG